MLLDKTVLETKNVHKKAKKLRSNCSETGTVTTTG